jgi:1,4-alpha-glucan branching enzyme
VDHHVNVPLPGKYREVFNSDDVTYGGSGVLNTGIMEAFPVQGNFLHCIRASIPPLGCTILERIPDGAPVPPSP